MINYYRQNYFYRAFFLNAFLSLLLSINVSYSQQRTVGLIEDSPDAFESFTLVSSLDQDGVYLVNNCGEVINFWDTDRPTGLAAYMMNNSNLLTTYVINDGSFERPGKGGGLEIRDWDDNVLWNAEFTRGRYGAHHDIEPLPNNNILVLLWENLSRDEGIALGRDPSNLNGELWPEAIFEIRPILGTDDFDVVWEWHLTDHIVQDENPSVGGTFGNPEDHPELVDINILTRFEDDWIHANAIDYNEERDEIILSTLHFNEFWIIDHSTTTEEAASHEGGARGKGGDLLYRWGNPVVYQRATASEFNLNSQHDVEFERIESDRVIISAYNNRTNASPNTSEVVLIEVPLQEDGNYQELEDDNETYLPEAPMFTFRGNPAGSITSPILSGIQLLPNDNIFVSVAVTSIYSEFTREGELVWQYRSPLDNSGIAEQGESANGRTFKSIKFAVDDPIFAGVDTSIKFASIVEDEDVSPCGFDNGTSSSINFENSNISIYPNPIYNGGLTIDLTETDLVISNFLIFDVLGRPQMSIDVDGSLPSYDIDLTALQSGIYFLVLNTNNDNSLSTRLVIVN